MHFSYCLTSIVINSSDEQSFSLFSSSSRKSIWWNCSVPLSAPSQVTSDQNFKALLCNFNSIICNISDFLAWNHFAWDQVTLVGCTPNINLRSVGVPTADYSVLRNRAGGCCMLPLSWVRKENKSFQFNLSRTRKWATSNVYFSCLSS